jgi:hypothetical protein
VGEQVRPGRRINAKKKPTGAFTTADYDAFKVPLQPGETSAERVTEIARAKQNRDAERDA